MSDNALKDLEQAASKNPFDKGIKEAYTSEELIQKYGEAGSKFQLEQNGQTYEGREVAVKGEPLVDPGTGKKLYIRNFIFSKNPAYQGRKLTNQEIFNFHWREVSRWLWGDGLRPFDVVEPKVTHTGNKYIITIVCEPRFGISAFDNSHTLQELLPVKSLPKKK